MDREVEQKPNILYVDDTEANLLLFEASFEKDFTVFLANSGSKGLEILRNNEIAVLISDQRMPGMSGTELLELATTEFPDVMRFMLTAYTDYDTVVESINKGQIYGFFNKPFKTKEVRVAINKALEVYYLRKKNQQMLEKLEQANKELLDMDYSRTRFLSTITEEIRTPISKIMSAVHMLKDKVDASELSELLAFLDTSVSRLESFSRATTQLARLKSPQTNVKNDSISLKEIVEISIIEMKNLLDENKLGIQLEELSGPAVISGEEELLLSCTGILLSNAVSHTGQEEKISVAIGEKSLSITDGGVNYSDEFLGKLGKLFSNNNPATLDAGIELALANQIMRSHGGKISIEKQSNNRICITMVFGDAE